jgi:DNA repair exonuclease SbcCD ATPase subunit
MQEIKYLTVSQAAAALGKSERSIRRQCAAGKLEAIEVLQQGGKAWQIPESAIERAANRGQDAEPHAASNAASAPLVAADAATIARLETQLQNVQAFLAGQINTREAVREDVKAVLDDALAPIVTALEAFQRENERLRDQIVAERPERAIERQQEPGGFWANIWGRKRGQLPPDR